MKKCYVCKRKSVIQDFVWENGRIVFKKRCCNPYCKIYNPYALWDYKIINN